VTEIRIALLGFGNVARALVAYLHRRSNLLENELVISAIADSSAGVLLNSPEQLNQLLEQKLGGRSLRQSAVTTGLFHDPSRFLEALHDRGITVLVESLPTDIETGEPALQLVTDVLRSGISVVTVDKGPLVHGFERLSDAARLGSTRFAFTGTTGVAIPDELANQRVVEIRGILNGTTNYILTAMQRDDLTFEGALSEAQAAGIAEPDPRLDVEGWDTASKILILARALMGSRASIDRVSRIGIGPETDNLIKVAKSSGRIVRLVGRARIWRGEVRVSVAPKLLDESSPLYSVSGASKAAVFTTRPGGPIVVHGRSGRDAISQTILEDVLKVSVGDRRFED
jgi:homoserine dehydrogenase